MSGGVDLAKSEFLHITGDELQRARRRVKQPSWSIAAETLRREAEAAAAKWPQLPHFDSAWFDARPERPFNETYNEFAAYAYPAWHLLGDAMKMLLADAVFEEDRRTQTALDWTRHVVREFKFHVKHHDAGLSYSHAAVLLASIYAFAGGRLKAPERIAFEKQLAACAHALRENTRHWLANLAHMPYNNHFAHHRLGLLAIGLPLGNHAWIDESLNGPRSFGELLAGATTDDGLCYESSTVYHFVTLDGLLKTAALAARHPTLARDLFRETFANGRNLKQMFEAPLALLWPNGEMAAVGDCYAYRQPIWDMREGIYEQAYGVYGDPRYAWLLQHAGARRTVEGLLYGADDLSPAEALETRSRIWVEHGYAFLTSETGAGYWQGWPVAAFLTGDRSGIHHHQDALSLQVAMGGRVWVEDVESKAMELQTFAAPIQQAFNRTMLPHNLVVVDEQDQPDNPEVLCPIEFKDLPGCATVAMADAGTLTSGVRRMRHVAVTPDYCLDLYQVTGDAEHVYDWLLHPRADAPVNCGDLQFTPVILPAAPPYSVLREVSAANIEDGRVALEWTQDNARFACDILASAPSAPAELIRAQWPTRSDGAGEWREMFMLRVRAAAADFTALYQMKTPQQPWRISQCRRLFNGQFHEIRIEVSRGGTGAPGTMGGAGGPGAREQHSTTRFQKPITAALAAAAGIAGIDPCIGGNASMKPLDTLISALNSEDPVVAGDAARLLGELNDTRAIPALLKYARNARHHYKSAGLWALGLLGKSAETQTRAQVAATLRDLVANPNVHDDWYWYSCRGVRASAALALLMLADESAAPYLRELADKNDDVFFCWFGPALLRLEQNCPAVGELQSRLTVAELLNTEKRKTRDTEPGLVTMKAQVLGILKGSEACGALENLASFHSRYVRGQSALSLLEASDAPAHVGLVEAMADADATDFARLKASLALALKGQAQRGDQVARFAASADPFDRAAAIESLGLLRQKKDAAVIRRQIARGDAYLRQCALEALERIDPETAVEAAKKLLRDPAPRVRHQAAKVLAANAQASPAKGHRPRTSKIRTSKVKRPARKASPAGARR